MIKRHYFYLIETQESDSNFEWGVVTTKSWFSAVPEILNTKLLGYFCERTGKDKNVCKLVKFNRV